MRTLFFVGLSVFALGLLDALSTGQLPDAIDLTLCTCGWVAIAGRAIAGGLQP